MNDISTPIQTQTTAHNPDTQALESMVFKKSRGKGKAGAFAKLLEGLLGKGRSTAPVSRTNAGGEQLAKTPRAAGQGKVSLKNTKPKSGGPLAAEDISDHSSGQDEILAFLGQALNNPLISPPNEAVLEGPNLSAKESGLLKSGVQKLLVDEDAAAGDGLFKETALKGIEEAVFDSAKAEMTKESKKENAQTFAASSAGNSETESYEFLALQKPDLAGLSQAAPKKEDVTNAGDRPKKDKNKISVEVRDLRTNKTVIQREGEAFKSQAISVPGTEHVDAEIPVELSLEGPGGRRSGSEAQSFSPSDFADALARELHENVNTDIVKQASLVLRDGGQGTLKLALRPETLGNVKIRLEMAENKITGHIFVESAEAFSALKRELPVLEKQFQDSGFGKTSLEMSFSGGNSSESFAESGNFGPEQRSEEFSIFETAIAAARYDAPLEAEMTMSEGQKHAPGINLLV
ncbi:MAG: flagellar hook-length control protein FliK [Treponema sp.]|nr:flagellar hook-length control protein FliK [Treponema sp.]